VYNYIKVSKFVKFANFNILEDFSCAYYIKLTKFDKLSNLVLLKIFMC